MVLLTSGSTRTPIPDLDNWPSANLCVRRCGADTEPQAAMQADRLLYAGDLDEAAVARRAARTTP